MAKDEHLRHHGTALFDDENLERAYKNDVLGSVAHTPGTGPAGHVCGTCLHAKSRGKNQVSCLKRVELRQQQRLSNPKTLPKHSRWTQACKYYEGDPRSAMRTS